MIPPLPRVKEHHSTFYYVAIGFFVLAIVFLLVTIVILQREVIRRNAQRTTTYIFPTPTTASSETLSLTPTPSSIPSQNPSTPTPVVANSARSWKVLALIYKSTHVSYSSQGSSKQLVTTMTEGQIADTITTLQQLPTTISAWSNGYAHMTSPTIVYPSRPISSISPTGDSFWVSPNDVKADIDQFAPPGSYDSIFVIWRKDDDTYNTIPSFGWGWSSAPSSITNGAGYSVITVPDGKQTFAQTDGYPGEIFIHEWNHQTTSFYQSKGHTMPDIDRAPSYGYSVNSSNSWQTFLSDVMQGKVKEGDTFLGITQTMWNTTIPTQQ